MKGKGGGMKIQIEMKQKGNEDKVFEIEEEIKEEEKD